MTVPVEPPAVVAPDAVRVAGRPGEAIALPLGQPPASGYEWRLQLPAAVTRLPDPPAPTRPVVAPGDPPAGAIRVEAKRGTHRIVATLARPWEPDQPVRTIVIALTVE